MKKFSVLILAFNVLLFALCACGSTANDKTSNTETMTPIEETLTEKEDTETQKNTEAMSITIGTETFTSGMSVEDVYAAAARIGITEEVVVGGLLSSGDNYIVTGLISHHSDESDCSFNFSAKASGDLDIESGEALKEALLESGILEGVQIFEYGDEIINFNYMGLDQNVTIDEVAAYMAEHGFENVERYASSVQGDIGDANVLFGFNDETMEFRSIMLHY